MPLEAGILELWDTTVLVIGRACTDVVCSSLPHHRPRKIVSIPGCCTSTYCFADRPHGPGHGSRLRTRLIGRDSRDPGAFLSITPQTELVDQYVIQGTFLLFRLWARVLFDSGASHLFIAASCVKDLGLEVETLENPLYVNSPLVIRVSVN